MIEDVIEEAKVKMGKAVDALRRNLMTIRTGRASPALVEGLRIECYGTSTPLGQLATIAVPEPRLIVIRPWDPNILENIERAILQSELGLNPINDGKIIRLPIPRLTEERRRDLTKLVSRRVEEGKIAVRNCRRDALKELRTLKGEGSISEDDFYRAKDNLQEVTDEFIAKMDELGERKEKEIMEF
ncbi:MAG: ribosome recycling factor [Chloroflexota bacterium]|nr:ribosome recycling factor [Chloroflexota bacterium]